ncbi:MAG: tetratricopeptide repeat protein [Chloroflexota bacterium]|nr:MAG: tetratricopeptide repeat protein [Chloroflexota bacterium]
MSTQIRTPDQRLRVFVSSTLKELAAERKAAQRAIDKLRLIPVMFELGARPHPSDELYRAYLEQSQIFIGIYWQQYGWIAPHMEISGIEDEYLLAKDLPKLIYLKSPAPEIESGLKTLIRKIQGDNTVSYKRFSKAEELQELIENDLAVLLTEQFYTLNRLTKSTELKEAVLPAREEEPLLEHNLPVQATPFIGRRQELAEICRMLVNQDVRLLTLTGPGGTGKTRLGIQSGWECLDSFVSGVYFIPLAEFRDPILMVSKIAQQLGIREGGSQPLFQTLKNHLRDKQILLLIDNFEQVIEGADLLAELLAAAPGLKLLVTSRVVLNLQGEYEYPVPPLQLPDREELMDLELVDRSEAFQLFVSRAQAISPHLKVDGSNSLVIAQICYQLDGLPLAIELAAARTRSLSPEMILERLPGKLDLLRGGARDLPERQQTLRNTLDWSYSLLDQDTQNLFSLLGVFIGGFTLEGAEAICRIRSGQCQMDVLDGLEVLIDNSLLRMELSSGYQPRYRMLEIIREYALEKLESSGGISAARDKHAQYYIEKISEASLLFQTSESERGLWWVESEQDNLRAALAWCLERPAFRDLGAVFLGAMDWFWYRRGYLSEGREWSRRMLNKFKADEPTAEQVLILFSSSALAMWQGDLKIALDTIDQALEFVRWLEYPFHLAVVLLFKGTTLVNMGRDEEAVIFLEESLALFSDLGMDWYHTTTLVHLANAALGMGDTELALLRLEQAQPAGKAINEKWLISFILNNFGEVHRVRGEYDKARRYYQESEALLREMGDKGDLARLVHNLGYLSLHQGDLDAAERQFRESLAMFLKLSNQRGIAECLSAIAGIRIEKGEYQTGARLLGAATNFLEQTGGSWWPADRVEINRIHDLLEGKLDQKELKTSFDSAQQLTLEAAVSLVSSS